MHLYVPLTMRNVIRVGVIDNLKWIVFRHIFVRLTSLLHHKIRMLLQMLLLTLEKVEALDCLNWRSGPGRVNGCRNLLMIWDVVLYLSYQICVVIQPEGVLDVQQRVLSLVGLIQSCEILIFSHHQCVQEISGLLGRLCSNLLLVVSWSILDCILNDLRQEDLWKLLMRLCLMVSERCGFSLFLSIGLVSLGWRALWNH